MSGIYGPSATLLETMLTGIFSPSFAPLNVLLFFYIALHTRSFSPSLSCALCPIFPICVDVTSRCSPPIFPITSISLFSPLSIAYTSDRSHREKLLTEHLRKIYGPTFSVESDLLSSAAVPPAAGVDTNLGNRSFVASPTPSSTLPCNRRTSGFGALVQSTSSGSLSTATQSKKGKREQQNESFDAVALMQQLEGVQDLVGRFERRLLIRESELLKKEEEAHLESRKLEKMEVGVVMKQAVESS